MGVLQGGGGNPIDREYERDPRRELFAANLQPREARTPIAGAAEVARTLIAALLQRRLQGEYQDRKAEYGKANMAALASVGKGGTSEDYARALMASSNPDVAERGGEYLAQSLLNQRAGRAPTYSTKPLISADNKAYQLSSAGGPPLEIQGFTPQPEKKSFMTAGDRILALDPRKGEAVPIEGGEIRVSPSAQFSAQQAKERESTRIGASAAQAGLRMQQTQSIANDRAAAADARAQQSRAFQAEQNMKARGAADARAAAKRRQEELLGVPAEDFDAELARREAAKAVGAQ